MPTSLRVLLVEDAGSDAGLILKQLNQAGYTVQHERVETAGQMLDALSRQTWDIITAEYNLPDFNAHKALSLLQSTQQDIPFIVISGEISEANAIALMEAGAYDYLSWEQLSWLDVIVKRMLTQRKKKNENLLASSLIRESEQKFRLLVEYSPNGIMVIDKKGIVTEWNQANESIFGYTRSEIVGRNGWDVQVNMMPAVMRTPETLAFSRSIITKLLDSGEANVVNQYREYQVVRKDGSTGWIGTNVFILQTENGPIAVNSSLDISQRKLAEEIAERKNDEIQSLYQVSLELNQTLDYDELLHTLYLKISQRMECDNFFVSAFDEETQLIHAVYANMETNRVDASGFPPIPLEPEGKGTQSVVIRSGEAILLNDYHTFVKTSSTNHYIDVEGRVNNYETLPDEEDVTRAGIIVPLKFKGRVLGAVQVMSYKLNAYTEEQYSYAKALTAQFGIAYNNALLYREAQAETAQRKIAETALQESDQKFSKAFEYAINGMTLTSLDGRWLKVNQALCDMVGYSEAELLGMNFQDITDSADIDKDQEVNSHLLQGVEENFMRYQKRYIHKDGHIVWVLINLSVVRDDNGQPLYFISQVNDISDIKQVEAALKLQGAALENAANAIVITDREGIIEWINPAWSKLTGFSRDEAFGKTNRILKSGRQEPSFYKNLWVTLLSGQVFRGDFINKRKDGSLYTAETVITPVINETNEITHYVSVIEDVTQRDAADELLRRSEESHRLTLQLALDGYWKVDLTGRLVDVNEAYSRMSGYSRDELLHMRVGDVEANESDADTAEHIQKVLRDGYDRFESRHRRKDGVLIDVESSVQYQEQTGEIISFLRDITESKQVNDALKVSEQKLKFLFELLPVGVTVLNKDRKVVYMNPALSRILHMDKQVVLDSKYIQRRYVHADGSPMPSEDFASEVAVRTSQGAFNIETGIILDDDVHNTIWTDVSAMPVSFADWRVIVVAADITDRKRAEEASRESEKRLQQALEAAKGGAWEWDVVTNQNTWSDELWSLYRLDKNKTEPSYESWLSSVHPDDRQKVDAAVQQASSTGSELNVEWKVNQPDGDPHWLLSRGQPLRDKNGKVIRYLGVVLDITERKLAEQELRQAHDELEQRVIHRTAELNSANLALQKAARLKDEFLASMSHELRTPLTGILGLSEALQMVSYGALNEKQVRAVKNIELSGRHLLTLINDMLDLSKIEAGKFDLQLENCSLADICQGSLALTRGLMTQKKQVFSYHMEPENIYLKADVRRLKQMIVNLLGNAIKFTPEGGRIGINVKGFAERNELEICIWDEGIGIRNEDLQKLFQPFVQLDSGLSRQYAGTGLGLSLVMRLAQLHHGRVDVSSEFGKGSRFTLVLPWLQVTPLKKLTGKLISAAPVMTSDAAGERPMILMADDNEMILDLVSDFLANHNFRVSTTHGGVEFLERLEQVRADLILMDIQMPGIDGIDVIRRVRAHPSPRVAALPVIAVTALAMEDDRERCLAAGANAYLSKPVQLTVLLEMIEQYCRPGAGSSPG